MNNVTEKTSTVAEHGTHLTQSYFNTRGAESATYDCNGNRLPYAIISLKEEWELITPEIAESFLNTMDRNRKLRQRIVKKYTADLKSGDFNICFDSPIIFNENGEMVNGQHRCAAIKESGIPCWCKIYRDVPNDTVIDKGLLRSTGDALWMRGEIDSSMRSTRVIATVKSYFRVKHNNDASDLTDSQIGDFLNRYGNAVLEAIRLSHLGVSNNAIADKSGVQAALFAAIICGVDGDKLARMMKVVNTGFQSSPEESAAIVLRNSLLEYTSHSSPAIRSTCAITEQAINDFVHGNPRTRRYKNPKHIYVGKCNADL